MDAHEMIAGHAEISAGVLCNDRAEFVLCPLDCEGNPLSEEHVQEARSKNFFYCGCLGYVNGAFGYKAEPGPLCALAMLQASLAFAQYVASRLQQAKTDDSAAWLQKLYSLEDSRDAN